MLQNNGSFRVGQFFFVCQACCIRKAINLTKWYREEENWTITSTESRLLAAKKIHISLPEKEKKNQMNISPFTQKINKYKFIVDFMRN